MAKPKNRSKLIYRCVALWAGVTLLFVACQPSEKSKDYNTLDMKGRGGFALKGRARVLISAIPAEFLIDRTLPEDARLACAAAAATVEKAAGRRLVTITSTRAPEPIPSGVFVLSWGQRASQSPDHHATTRITVEGQSIIGAHISFDATSGRFSLNPDRTEGDLESVCLHEILHALGLSHVRERDSVMYPVLQDGTVKRALSPRDIERLRSAYGLAR